jgi:hypothetical protein
MPWISYSTFDEGRRHLMRMRLSAPYTSKPPGGKMKQHIFNSAKIFRRIGKGLLYSWLFAVLATHVQAASDVLFYNPTNGSATIGSIEADGQFSSSFHYPPGSFSANWSHIVKANNGFLFFYRQTDGFFAVGRPDANVGFVTRQTGYLTIYTCGLLNPEL